MPSIFAYPRRLFKPFAKGGPLASTPSEGPMTQRLNKGRHAPNIDILAQRIILPSLPVADEDMTRLRHWETGRSMARQDRWEILAEAIVHADDARLTTPGGADEATLLALGAQSDVTAAASDALADGAEPNPAGLQDLEEILGEFPDNHAIALVVALAHLNIGRAWLAASAEAPRLISQHHSHFKAAQALLSPFDADDLDAPSLAAAQCALAEILCPDIGCVSAAYLRLLHLDAHNPNHIRAYGRALMLGLADDPELLERQAMCLPHELRSIWNDGAYAWLYLDVLSHSDEALAAVDTSRFARSLRHIVQRQPDQHLINELAAFCALVMAPREADTTRVLVSKRAALHENLDWILSDHLSELHPLVWSEQTTPAATSPRYCAPRTLVAQGRKTALRIIAGRFADQLADGSSIAFSPAGMYRLPAM